MWRSHYAISHLHVTFHSSYGIFRLTDPPGLDVITRCREPRAFHPHPDVPIYTVSQTSTDAVPACKSLLTLNDDIAGCHRSRTRTNVSTLVQSSRPTIALSGTPSANKNDLEKWENTKSGLVALLGYQRSPK